jgi:hypothetical protein
MVKGVCSSVIVKAAAREDDRVIGHVLDMSVQEWNMFIAVCGSPRSSRIYLLSNQLTHCLCLVRLRKAVIVFCNALVNFCLTYTLTIIQLTFDDSPLRASGILWKGDLKTGGEFGELLKNAGGC